MTSQSASARRSVRSWALPLGVAALSTGLSLVAVELVYRAYCYRQFTDARYGIVVQSAEFQAEETHGHYRPNTTARYRMFDADHHIQLDATVRINNFGYVSHYDYRLEKQPGEYRIALLGDSLTACFNNDKPWADSLQEVLNADDEFKAQVGAQTVSVLNFGTPGAGFHTMAKQGLNHAAFFAPDLVIVNYIEDDFLRERGVDFLAARSQWQRNSYEPFVRPPHPAVSIDGASVHIFGVNPDDLSPGADPLREPNAVIGNEFIIPDEALALDGPRVQKIKSELARRYVGVRLWRSWRPYSLLRAMGQPTTLSHSRHHHGNLFSTDDEALAHATQAFDALLAESGLRNMLLLRNPLYDDVTGVSDLRFTERLTQKRPELEVVRMEPHLPADVPASDKFKWYNLPHDGHWSNRGAVVYAQAIQKMLTQRGQRLAAKGKQP